jgi:hypothetical protein
LDRCLRTLLRFCVSTQRAQRFHLEHTSGALQLTRGVTHLVLSREVERLLWGGKQ